MELLRFLGYGAGAIGVYLVGRRLLRTAPMMPPLSTQYMAVSRGGTRDLAKLRLLVIHSTEGDSARSTAAWFTNPASKGSTHVVVDDKEGFRTLPDSAVPYGSGGGSSANDSNVRGLHLEFSGHAKWTRAEWLRHDAMLRRGGEVLGAWAAQYGIPLVMLGPEAVRDGIAQGIATHHTITQAFGIAGGHVDPGDGFPLDVVLRYARGG